MYSSYLLYETINSAGVEKPYLNHFYIPRSALYEADAQCRLNEDYVLQSLRKWKEVNKPAQLDSLNRCYRKTQLSSN
jgi:hypothetical protein